MPLQGAYNVDWVYATASNVHVAKDRDWFFNYTPFPSRLSTDLEVLGIGDVQLEVNKKQPNGEGGAYHSLILRDVLHVPETTTNVVAAPVLEDFRTCSFRGNGEITDPSTGVTLLLDMPKLFKLWLVGQPRGQTSLDVNKDYMLNARWSPDERARWEAFKSNGSASADVSVNGLGEEIGKSKSKKQKKKKKKGKKQQEPTALLNGDEVDADAAPGSDEKQIEQDMQKLGIGDGADAANTASTQDAADDAAPKPSRFSAEEKAWLKANYGNEYKFLRANGLKIYKNSDRRKGEEMMRAMMGMQEGTTGSWAEA